MSQHDYNIANQTFPATRTDLNNALGAIATNNAGNSAPSTTYANQWWFDSDGNQLYMRNKDNDAWVSILSIGASSDSVETIHCTSGSITIDSAARIDLSADDNGEVRLFDGSSMYGQFKDDSDNFHIQSIIQDKDIHFIGNDGGSAITAMVIDMSEGGRVGIGETSPLGKLHIKSADSGASAHVSADELVIEGSANSGINILSGNSSEGSIYFGDDGDNDVGRIRYDHTNNSLDFFTNASERMSIDSSGVATFTSSLIATGLLNTVNNSLLLIGGGNAGNTGSNLTMYGGADGSAGAFRFRNATTVTANITATGQIECVAGAVSAPSYSFTNDTDTGMTRPTTDTLQFVTGGSERMRINSSGYVGINTNSPSVHLEIHTNNNIGGIETQPKVDQLYYAMIFRNSSGNDVGNIAVTSSATAFNTSSDYRLKENVSYDFDATTRLKQLKPARFNWISDDTNTLVDGFLAHEVSDIVPEAITGEKDATETRTKVVLDSSGNQIAKNVEEADWEKGKFDILWTSDDIETQDVLYTSDDVETQDVLYTEEDELPEGVEVGEVKESATKSVGDVKQEATQTVGDVKTEAIYPSDSTWVASKVYPKHQKIDQSKLVPLLVKTIQELEARITALES